MKKVYDSRGLIWFINPQHVCSVAPKGEQHANAEIIEIRMADGTKIDVAKVVEVKPGEDRSVKAAEAIVASIFTQEMGNVDQMLQVLKTGTFSKGGSFDNGT